MPEEGSHGVDAFVTWLGLWAWRAHASLKCVALPCAESWRVFGSVCYPRVNWRRFLNLFWAAGGRGFSSIAARRNPSREFGIRSRRIGIRSRRSGGVGGEFGNSGSRQECESAVWFRRGPSLVIRVFAKEGNDGKHQIGQAERAQTDFQRNKGRPHLTIDSDGQFVRGRATAQPVLSGRRVGRVVAEG